MTKRQGDRYRELLAAEQRSARLYDGLAAAADGERKKVLGELAAVERRHAEHWAGKLSELGESPDRTGAMGVRDRILVWLARKASIDTVLPYLERNERADAGLYQDRECCQGNKSCEQIVVHSCS